MMEAIGHSNLHSWRPTVLYNAAVVYSWLTLLAILSSIFRQIAYCWMEPEKLERFEVLKKQSKLTIQGEIWFSLQDISDDWRWQRVFGQLGVVVLMGTYLSFVDDASGNSMDQLAGLVLAAVIVACIWSFGVAAVVTFRSLSHILAQALPSLANFARKAFSPVAKFARFARTAFSSLAIFVRRFRVSDDQSNKNLSKELTQIQSDQLDLENGSHTA